MQRWEFVKEKMEFIKEKNYYLACFFSWSLVCFIFFFLESNFFLG